MLSCRPTATVNRTARRAAGTASSLRARRRTPVHSGGYTMKRHLLTAAAAGVAMMLGAGGSANAAEIKVISSNALKTALEALAPQFEKATEHKLVFVWGAA